MTIYTLNVGQGQFVIVTGQTEAIIVDSYVPLNAEQTTVHVRAALAKATHSRNVVGFIATGFDSDHFNKIGLQIILNKYRPSWCMYPRYFKETDSAGECFALINAHASKHRMDKVSALLSDPNKRWYSDLSKDFFIELFSPHPDDMTSSNNCSLVCSLTERASGMKYLVTGDTEDDRWESIAGHFGGTLRSDVLAAPHHGSRHGITVDAIKLIRPHTVLISAGVANQYGHPHAEAISLFRNHAVDVFSTGAGGGQSLRTICDRGGTATTVFSP